MQVEKPCCQAQTHKLRLPFFFFSRDEYNEIGYSCDEKEAATRGVGTFAVSHKNRDEKMSFHP